MEKILTKDDLLMRLELIENIVAKINFLELFVKNEQNISPGLLATIYEKLGEFNGVIGKYKGSFYQKAGSAWETAAIFYPEDSKKRKEFFNNAYKDYKISLLNYKKQNSWIGVQETKIKINKVRKELGKFGENLRLIVSVILISLFLISFIFLSSPITGFALAPLEIGGTTYTGFVIVILCVIGMIYVLKRWF